MDIPIFNYPKTRYGNLIHTSVTISEEFYKAARIHNFKFSEALRIGISIMLAEMGEAEYDNNLNFMRKINLLRTQLEKTSQELESLKSKQEFIKV